MGIYVKKSDQIAEALIEYVVASEICLAARKSNGGCLGYPSALLLLHAIEAIGGFHRKLAGYSVQMGDSEYRITCDTETFRILNDSLFGLSLNEHQAKTLYTNYRCKLSHNAALKPKRILEYGNLEDEPFRFDSDGNVNSIRLISLHKIVKSAVLKFVENGKELIEESRCAKGIDHE